MKKMMTLALVLCMALTGLMTASAEEITVSANSTDVSEQLDLTAVATLFARSKNLEAFETALNNPDSSFTNLDLNGDGVVDYLRVIETTQGNKHLIVLQAILAKDIYQDVATILVEKDETTGSVKMQVSGDERLYGEAYVIEPVFYYRPVIYDWFWGPHYYAWHSPYYWDYWPGWWHPYYPCHTVVYVERCHHYNHMHAHCSYRSAPAPHRDVHRGAPVRGGYRPEAVRGGAPTRGGVASSSRPANRTVAATRPAAHGTAATPSRGTAATASRPAAAKLDRTFGSNTAATPVRPQATTTRPAQATTSRPTTATVTRPTAPTRPASANVVSSRPASANVVSSRPASATASRSTTVSTSRPTSVSTSRPASSSQTRTVSSTPSRSSGSSSYTSSRNASSTNFSNSRSSYSGSSSHSSSSFGGSHSSSSFSGGHSAGGSFSGGGHSAGGVRR